ncbi:M28 family peptidase, partial [Candidatus Amoebophilus asiaticus]|nr:M28 family peptidase [Candidatus Amoebophilus asiaticus]
MIIYLSSLISTLFTFYSSSSFKIIILALFLVLIKLEVFSQDLNYARKIIDTLASEFMQGRGYVNDGDKKAASFIEAEFRSMTLLSFRDTTNPKSISVDYQYRQNFKVTVNTFPENVYVRIDKQPLIPGVHYLIAPNSGSGTGKAKIIWFNNGILSNDKLLRKFQKKRFKNKMVFVDSKHIKGDINSAVLKMVKFNLMGAKGICDVKYDKLSWSTSSKAFNFPVIYVSRKAVPFGSKKIFYNIKNEYVRDYTTQNLIGYLKGNVKPDSFVVFTAHYDHLGRLGSLYFPGANDNASGIAMLLNLSKYYSDQKQMSKYSMVFIAFSGEELGLSGSRYFTEKPLFPLSNIKFLINLDLLGTGEEGICVVNGK